MQYLLTEQEYKELKEQAQANLLRASVWEQELCTRIADTMPAGVEWIGEEEPWGCIITREGAWYCDGCPVQEVCPQDFKQWSK